MNWRLMLKRGNYCTALLAVSLTLVVAGAIYHSSLKEQSRGKEPEDRGPRPSKYKRIEVEVEVDSSIADEETSAFQENSGQELSSTEEVPPEVDTFEAQQPVVLKEPSQSLAYRSCATTVCGIKKIFSGLVCSAICVFISFPFKIWKGIKSLFEKPVLWGVNQVSPNAEALREWIITDHTIRGGGCVILALKSILFILKIALSVCILVTILSISTVSHSLLCSGRLVDALMGTTNRMGTRIQKALRFGPAQEEAQ